MFPLAVALADRQLDEPAGGVAGAGVEAVLVSLFVSVFPPESALLDESEEVLPFASALLLPLLAEE